MQKLQDQDQSTIKICQVCPTYPNWWSTSSTECSACCCTSYTYLHIFTKNTLHPTLDFAPPPPTQLVQAVNILVWKIPEDNLNYILDNITQRYTPKLKKSTFIYGEHAAKVKNPYKCHQIEISLKDAESLL